MSLIDKNHPNPRCFAVQLHTGEGYRKNPQVTN